jgi:hypothetical protein
MTNRVRLAILLSANIAAAVFSVAGSGWLWVRASESTVEPTVAPALPAVVGEVSVPFAAEASRASQRARRERTGSPRSVKRRHEAPRARRVVDNPARPRRATTVRVRSAARPIVARAPRTRAERPTETTPPPPPPPPPPPSPQPEPQPPPPVRRANPQPQPQPQPPPSDDDEDDDDDDGGDDEDDDDGRREHDDDDDGGGGGGGGDDDDDGDGGDEEEDDDD